MLSDVDSAAGSASVSPQLRPLSRNNSTISLGNVLFRDFDFGFNLDGAADKSRKKFHEMRSKTDRQLKSFKDYPKRKMGDVHRLQKELNAKVHEFDERIHSQLVSSNTEKAFYAFALCCIFVAGLIIGKYPEHFHVFHTCLFVLLMPIRFYTYFKMGYEYYLADLCYYVNLLVMAFLWLFPWSQNLFISVFSLSLGTLSFAVITWRNSLVLHSIEKTTSSFIHIMPPVTMFVIVHEIDPLYQQLRFSGVSNIASWDFAKGIWYTALTYSVWQVLYHYFITIRKARKIESGKVTSFTHLRKSKANSPLGRFVNSLPYNWMQIGAFTLIQFGYQMLTMLPCPIWFKYKHACGVFVFSVFAWACYNGATYYIDIFGKRFEKEVAKLKKEVAELEREKIQWSPQTQPQAMSEEGIVDIHLGDQTDNHSTTSTVSSGNNTNTATATGMQRAETTA
ncbi:hypothetical protein DIURU_000135 [Diutina rugosa]|uniref:Glycerophosphocholine acyltransferase 1 n=1 Tax=Diutina rugosa TaxID=5481 RepID=A0A642V170_DIURU|nr:uncharacterized protein DIURU_000135 [Diutina rugosa]KAA8908592.1 hypothetical protein DIURU_000135 [Diutina rugosa]